jgi:hypothetical protein
LLGRPAGDSFVALQSAVVRHVPYMEGATMRRLTFFCCTALAVVGCARSEDQTTTDTAAGTAAATVAPAPATISLADVAGRWNVRTTPESGPDTSVVTYVLTATSDTTGWTMAFPNRPQPVPIRIVAVAGDSIVYTAGPFPSVRRRGVQVTTEGVARLRDGRLVGNAVAHYRTTSADSVLRVRIEGTKAP